MVSQTDQRPPNSGGTLGAGNANDKWMKWLSLEKFLVQYAFVRKYTNNPHHGLEWTTEFLEKNNVKEPKEQDFNSHDEWYDAMDVYFSTYYLQQDLIKVLSIYHEVNDSKQKTVLKHSNQKIVRLSMPSSLDPQLQAVSAQSLFHVVEKPPAKGLADDNGLDSNEKDNKEELMLARVKFQDCQWQNKEETFFSSFHSEDCHGHLTEGSSLRLQFPQLFGKVPPLPLMGDVTSSPHVEFPAAQLTTIFNKETTQENDNNKTCKNEGSLPLFQVTCQNQEMKFHRDYGLIN